jgi:hypothetical protein
LNNTTSSGWTFEVVLGGRKTSSMWFSEHHITSRVEQWVVTSSMMKAPFRCRGSASRGRTAPNPHFSASACSGPVACWKKYPRLQNPSGC